MQLERKLLFWVDKLRDISAYGLKFTTNFNDKENYTKIQEIAFEMIVLITNNLNKGIKPLIFPYLSRPGPLIGGDGAVINSKGEILLIQRADNQMWAMPGGLLEVGETPAEGVIREIFEETGIECQAIELIGIFDSRFWQTSFPFHMYHLLFLCSPIKSSHARTATHEHETLTIDWFKESSLPEKIDLGHILRIPKAFQVWKGYQKAFFDQ
ncbi:NUDIX hydrolase N-terminal domain-containing protein [Candidatus Hodarchaeum mangrovi]